jgi:hypothetical protein
MHITIGPKLEFPVAPLESWHVKRSKRFLTEGGVKRRSQWIPPTDCAWARIRHGFLLMRRAYATARPGLLVLDCAEGRRLIAIEVSHAAPVCVDVGRVVAMSTTVRLRTRISLSLAATSTNCVFVKQAWCPQHGTTGTIVLETAGEPTAASGQNATFDVSRMIAWDPSIEFRTTRLESLPCVLFEPVCISASSPHKGSAVLLDADDTPAGFSAWKGVRQLLSLVIPGL